ncbi:hypothetical protein ABID42_001638 [Arcicella rosea]|uniref:hypothetical protein n=1 Tax=Arcicella rosea TaxID=502909 RepID=UPI00345D879E
MAQSIKIKQPLHSDLYDAIKNGETWAFEYLEKILYSGHLFELKGDSNTAFDLYHDVIIELYIRVTEGKIEKLNNDNSAMIIAWAKRHLDWKRRDYWKSCGYKDVSRLDNVTELFGVVQSEAESILYYQQVITLIDGMPNKCRDLLTDKLINDLEWKKIYQKYPNDNEGSLRVLFSNCLKILRDQLDE